MMVCMLTENHSKDIDAKCAGFWSEHGPEIGELYQRFAFQPSAKYRRYIYHLAYEEGANGTVTLTY
jgi:hypothetical protein